MPAVADRTEPVPGTATQLNANRLRGLGRTANLDLPAQRFLPIKGERSGSMCGCVQIGEFACAHWSCIAELRGLAGAASSLGMTA